MAEVAGAAVLVAPGDVEALAGALDTALSGSEEDRAVSERRMLGFAIVGRHTWERSTDLHIAAYRTAARASPLTPDGSLSRRRRAPGV